MRSPMRIISADPEKGEVVVVAGGTALLVKETRGEYWIATPNTLTSAARGVACHAAAEALAEKRKEQQPAQLALI